MFHFMFQGYHVTNASEEVRATSGVHTSYDLMKLDGCPNLDK